MPNPYTREELIAYLTKSFEPGEKIFIVDMFSAESLDESRRYWGYEIEPLDEDQFESICDQLSDDQWLFEQLNGRIIEITNDVVGSAE